jgi:hypothetical protein
VSQYIKVECLNTERERRGERKKREGKCPSTDEQVYIGCNNTMNITEQKKKRTTVHPANVRTLKTLC